MSEKGDERRQATRKRTDIALEVFDPDGHLIVGVGRLADVSILGGRFTSVAPLDKNQVVRVHFRIDQGELLELSAKVIWVERRASTSEYGVSFEHPTAAQLRRLEGWLALHPEAAHLSVISPSGAKKGQVACCPTCLRPFP